MGLACSVEDWGEYRRSVGPSFSGRVPFLRRSFAGDVPVFSLSERRKDRRQWGDDGGVRSVVEDDVTAGEVPVGVPPAVTDDPAA